MNKILLRLNSIIRLVFLKLKYRKKLIIKKDTYRSKIASMNNIVINHASIDILGSVTIGKMSRISANNGGKIVIRDKLFINTGCVICSKGKIVFGENVSIGPNCCIYDHDHVFGKNGKEDGFKTGEVSIGKNVWIGANVVILKNTVIGDNCVIGAGTVIKGVIPKNSLVTSDRNLTIKKLHD